MKKWGADFRPHPKFVWQLLFLVSSRVFQIVQPLPEIGAKLFQVGQLALQRGLLLFRRDSTPDSRLGISPVRKHASTAAKTSAAAPKAAAAPETAAAPAKAETASTGLIHVAWRAKSGAIPGSTSSHWPKSHRASSISSWHNQTPSFMVKTSVRQSDRQDNTRLRIKTSAAMAIVTKRHHCHDLIPSKCHAKAKTSSGAAFIRAKQSERNAIIMHNALTAPLFPSLFCLGISFRTSIFVQLRQG
jgi:hypothetical protein